MQPVLGRGVRSGGRRHTSEEPGNSPDQSRPILLVLQKYEVTLLAGNDLFTAVGMKRKVDMKILVLGASGATGRHVAEMLLSDGHNVTIIVRSAESLPHSLKNRDNLITICASLLDLNDEEIAKHVRGCDAVASCLGHNLTFKGMYGHPRMLVTDAARRLCEAIKKNQQSSPSTSEDTSSAGKPIKYVLMNSSGNSNRDLNEEISFKEKFVIGMIRLLVPPHRDNEMAADYLRTQIGQDDGLIEWAAVRPDGLIDEEKVSEYEAFPSPIRSAIFNAGKVSRINVAHFMAELIGDDELWQKWKGKMPVLYGESST